MNTQTENKPHVSLKPVLKSSPELQEACERLIQAFQDLFAQQELIKADKKLLQQRAQKIGLTKEDINVIVKLCRERAKGLANNEPGDLAQQWLFDLEEEKKRAETLIYCLPSYQRKGMH